MRVCGMPYEAKVDALLNGACCLLFVVSGVDAEMLLI
jgi:hypothetical protein